MEQSSFQGKLIRSARDAAAIKVHSKEDPPDFRMRSTKDFVCVKRTCQTFGVIIIAGTKVHSKEDPPDFRMRSTKDFVCVKRTCQTFEVIIIAGTKVHSKEDPPDFRMRSTKVFAWDRRTSQTKAIFQVIIADGCLFYGNYALRSRGGCCICLLMASGLTAKRFSMWVADAEEGEFYYTISSEQFKLAVFIILPRVVNTSHQCVSHSEMDDNRSGGHENITKDFLTYAVRHLSRLYVGKTKGQEVYWKHHPPNWPEHLTWKNPTSSPKDSTETLREKYKHLRLLVPDEKLSPEERNAFKNFEAGNTDSVKSFMSFNKLNDHINDMRNMLHCLQQPHLQLLDEQLKLLKDEVTSQVSSSSVASTSRRPTAADTSSLTLSKKRKHVNPKSVQSKICKTEIPNCSNNIQDNGRKIKIIFPKPTPTSNEFSRVFPQSTVSAQSSVVESPMRNTFSNQSQQSLVSSNNTMSNICIDISKCRTLPDHPETAGSTNVPPSVVASSIIIIHSQYDNPLLGSHEELTVSDSIPVTSLDSGTWSQESNISKEAYDVRLDKQKLNDKVVQDDLQFIENICETTGQNNDFDPSQFINFGT